MLRYVTWWGELILLRNILKKSNYKCILVKIELIELFKLALTAK